MKDTTKKQKALNGRREKRQRRRIAKRLKAHPGVVSSRPVIGGGGVVYEVAQRGRGLGVAGIGVLRQLVHRLGLAKALNRALSLFRRHSPYWESDHVLNIAFNALAGGECLEDIKRLRWDEAYLDALGAERLPDATTAGDFCRRFKAPDVEALMTAINGVRLKVWAEQPEHFFDFAVIDADGTFASTTGERKEGMDISYKGDWGYHPLLVSLANTGEPLFLVNRSGNRPSNEGAAPRLDQAVSLCRSAGFRGILLRGDTDFSQTEHLDRWDKDGVEFVFGIDSAAGLKRRAEELAESQWTPLERRPKYVPKTGRRARRPNYKERIIRERGFKNIKLQSEAVAEFAYKPTKCDKTYRVVVVRKNLTIERGETALFDAIRYLFYITNERELSATEIVILANERCDQENLIKQLKSGVHAMSLPGHDLVSNWAYMVMASLAWNLKAWFALMLPETGRWRAKHAAEKRRVVRMEFRTFLNAFIRVPGELVTTARRTIIRLTGWNPWQPVLLRAMAAFSAPMQT